MTEDKNNGSSLGGWLLTIVGGLVLLAALIFLLMQGAERASFNVFGGVKYEGINTNVVMLFAALGGVILLYALRILIAGIRKLLRRRALRRAQQPAAPAEPQ